MKRFPIVASLLLLPALALMVVVGCGDKKPPTPPPGVDNKDNKTTEATPITAPAEGVVNGTVKLKGKAPEPKKEARILAHEDKDKCLKGNGKHVMEQTWLVKDGFVENVVVSLEPPDGKKYKIDEKLKDSFKTKKVVIDQPFCAYVPHIVAVYADVQPIEVKNSAKFAHNTKITGEPKNGNTNDPIGPGKHVDLKPFRKDSNPIPVECSMHTWMNAKILTFDHPYFAVTNEKGEYKIENVPVGEDLVVFVWHESMAKKEARPKVSATKEGKTLDLEIDGPK